MPERQSIGEGDGEMKEIDRKLQQLLAGGGAPARSQS